MPCRSCFLDANLAVDGQLIPWLVEWRRKNIPPYSWPECAELFNEAREAKAVQVGAPVPDPVDGGMMRRWGLDLGVDNPKFRLPKGPKR